MFLLLPNCPAPNRNYPDYTTCTEMYTMEMAWGGCLRTLTLAVAINRMELFLLPPYLPLPPHQNSCHKEALGELSRAHLVVLRRGVCPGLRGEGGCCAMRVGEGSEVSGKWQPSPGVSGGKLLLNGEMKMGN